MNMRKRASLSIVVASALVLAVGAWAAWVANGNPVCTATGVQDYVAITANGLGGAVMVWQDNRGASQDIYAQQIDNFGNNEWTANGVALCTNAAFQQYPQIAYDIGYLFYAWQDYRGGNADIYAAVTDRLGNIFTLANGAALCTATGDQSSFSLAASTGLGVGYAAWADARGGTNDIYAQSFNVVGSTFWPANGLAICTATGDQTGTAIVRDESSDGAVVVWQDFRSGNYDIYAQRANLSGVLQWAANGVVVCNQAAAQLAPKVINDGSGGVIIAWEDRRAGTFTQAIYAQRLNSAGVPQWAANGVLVAQSSDLIILPKMIPDGAGGAYFAWEDDRNISTTGPDVYAQRIGPSGNVLWAANGVNVCAAPFAQYSVDITRGYWGQPVISWFDYRSLSTADVYVQAIDASNGASWWVANGILLCGAAGNQFGPRITSDGTGAAIVSWEDRRAGSGNPNIYALRINDYTGEIGHPEPVIVSVTDVPSDAGGYVTVQWTTENPANVSGFQIYRGTSPGNWTDMVANELGDGSATYNTVVPTTADGVLNYFMVFEFTNDFQEYNSNEKSGMSESQATPIGDTPGLPKALALRPNSPNPFSATTQLHVGLPREADVQLEVYDVAGRRVFARDLGRMGAGWRDFSFDGRGSNGQPLASGVYFYRITAAGETTTRKMVIGR